MREGWSTATVGAAAGMALIVGLAAGATFQASGWNVNAWASNWGSLTAGGLAIIAALIAANPARKQLQTALKQEQRVNRDRIAQHIVNWKYSNDLIRRHMQNFRVHPPEISRRNPRFSILKKDIMEIREVFSRISADVERHSIEIENIEMIINICDAFINEINHVDDINKITVRTDSDYEEIKASISDSIDRLDIYAKDFVRYIDDFIFLNDGIIANMSRKVKEMDDIYFIN